MARPGHSREPLGLAQEPRAAADKEPLMLQLASCGKRRASFSQRKGCLQGRPVQSMWVSAAGTVYTQVLVPQQVMLLFSRPVVSDCDCVDCSRPGSSVHGFPRRGSWSGLPFPSPGRHPNPRTESVPPALVSGFFITELPG